MPYSRNMGAHKVPGWLETHSPLVPIVTPSRPLVGVTAAAADPRAAAAPLCCLYCGQPLTTPGTACRDRLADARLDLSRGEL